MIDNSASASRPFASLFLATFGILALELSVIRWMSQQIRLFAYLNNVLLIGAFLGMGIGVAFGRRRPQLVHLLFPLMTVLAAVLAFSAPLHLLHLGFPDAAIAMWGIFPARNFVVALLIIVSLLLLVAAVFAAAGVVVGDVFARSDSLRAYAYDLAGSIAGIVLMAVLAALRTPPPVWFACALAPFLLLSRKWYSVAGYILVIALSYKSIEGGMFSPYYRIDISNAENIAGNPLRLSVNRDFHQYMLNLSSAAIANPALDPLSRVKLASASRAYEVPFRLSHRHDRALVLGAGTGNDVAAALRAGFHDVTAVDIDPVILRIGRAMHPEKPYSVRGVTQVANDARAYMQQYRGEQYDVVCFGLLDSHAMFSAMSSLRLDNYVYTVESMRTAYGLVRPGGVLSLSFSTGNREWLAARLYKVVAEASGHQPLVISHGVQGGQTFLVRKDANVRSDIPLPPVRSSTDDWPFLYLKPGAVPYGYISVLSCILIIAVTAVRAAYGTQLTRLSRVDAMMFWIGAAFLLIETRGVTNLSLLFGSTWIVNTTVFFGILVTAFAANEFVRRFQPQRLAIFFVLLLGALALTYLVPTSLLLKLPLITRGVFSGLLNALPVGCAGIIFSSLLRDAETPESALGANLLGAVLGGCAEYLSMVIGLRALTLVAALFYLTALYIFVTRIGRHAELTSVAA